MLTAYFRSSIPLERYRSAHRGSISESYADVSLLPTMDSVKQDVRFTDNHLGRSAEGIVAG